MACIKIILTDHESGNVKIDTDPDIEKLLQIAKSHIAITPAESYAMIALKRIIDYSGELAKEKTGLPGTPRAKLM